jgi:hypothetical protein
MDVVSMSPSVKWPPERGWPFFIAWMAGALAWQILHQMMDVSHVSMAADSRIVWLIPIIITRTWQGWLLFRSRQIRLLAWIIIPCVAIVFPPPARIAQFVGYTYPLFEAALLTQIRQRPWLWIVATYFGVLIWFVGFPYASMAGDFIVDKLNDIFGLLRGGLLATVQTGAIRSVGLLIDAILAIVLAWKMPPPRQTTPHK